MSIKDIVVHVDDGRACQGRLSAALELAQSWGAHLVGVYVDPGLRLPVMVDAPMSPEFMDRLEEERRERIEAAKSLFDKLATASGGSTEWRCVEGELVGAVRLHGRYGDLVVVGQEGDDDEKIVYRGLPDSLVLELGRPMLIVPYIGAPERFGQRVLIAWNGSREAVRAVNDALPLLQRASVVSVLVINPESHRSGDLPGADICLHLARHGVNAQAEHAVANDIDVGDVLLSRASDKDADLIVMGAYGHSRLRETVLGGATKHLLKHMTVPVLMSH